MSYDVAVDGARASLCLPPHPRRERVANGTILRQRGRRIAAPILVVIVLGVLAVL